MKDIFCGNKFNFINKENIPFSVCYPLTKYCICVYIWYTLKTISEIWGGAQTSGCFCVVWNPRHFTGRCHSCGRYK